MLNIPAKLKAQDEPIKVGLIGAGFFGTKLIDQIERAPGMKTAVIADINKTTAAEAYREAGVDKELVTEFEMVDEATNAIIDGQRAILGSGFDLVQTDIDVVVEATGVPGVGAQNAYEAIMNDKHVVMVNVEADTVVGPLLAELADKNDVTYSMAYGDQPALITELCDWAELIGLDIVAAGKGNPFLEEYRYGTPDDVFERWEFDESFVEEQDLNPKMYNSFLDGTKVAVEMCAVANGTGLEPDVSGMHLPTAEISEIPEVLCPEEDGGILSNSGVVDTVSTLYPDGSSVEHDISFGVFIVTTTPNERVQQYLKENSGAGLYVSNDGKYQVFHRPYHLPGSETTVSIANAALRNEPTGVSREHVAEVVGAAKRKLEPGDVIDGGGGHTVYGKLGSAERAIEQAYVPFELLEEAKITSTVAKDEIVTYDDVELSQESFIYRLRKLQDAR